jgi:hypothetical protein
VIFWNDFKLQIPLAWLGISLYVITSLIIDMVPQVGEKGNESVLLAQIQLILAVF